MGSCWLKKSMASGVEPMGPSINFGASQAKNGWAGLWDAVAAVL